MAARGVGRFWVRVVAAPATRYGALTAVGFALVGLETARGSHRVGDFWEHAATVRELMLHLGSPGNPLLNVHAPSAFFSPYAVAVAWAADVLGSGPVSALAVAGLVNYWLLVIGLRAFTRVFSTRAQAPFYALVGLWLLWGLHPWAYSGVFDLQSLGAVIAYPSTFATGLGMLVVALFHRSLAVADARRRWSSWAACAVGMAIVLLTHPVAGLAFAVAVTAVAVTPGGGGRLVSGRAAAGAGAGILAAGALLCVAWPYYPALRLLGNQGVYDPSNALMYESWALKVLPAFAVIAVAFHATGSLRRLRLAAYCLPLLAVFLYGAASGHWSEGREISYVVLGAQIGLADLAASVEDRAASAPGRAAILAWALGLGVFALLEMGNMATGVEGSLPRTGSPEPAAYAAYRQAVEGLPGDATILAPLHDGAEAAIPTYAGRLVATDRPLAFLGGQQARRDAVNAFYAPGTPRARRAAIIDRYRVSYVLVPDAMPVAERTALAGLGRPVRETARYRVVSVDGSAAAG